MGGTAKVGPLFNLFMNLINSGPIHFMHPNAFIEQLWRGTEVDRVFVAMTFDARYESRYKDIIRPAIESVDYRGRPLIASRVDESKSGDSILTEIICGICEARLVLADVSDLSEGSRDTTPMRNGNVMYELGLAHAVKSPGKVLIVRDDSKPLLFDVSSVPHVTVNFNSAAEAKYQIAQLLVDRLQESQAIFDIKLRSFVESISDAEARVLLTLFTQSEPADLRVGPRKVVPLNTSEALLRLREFGLVKSHVYTEPFSVLYSLTERGRHACIALARTWNASKQDG